MADVSVSGGQVHAGPVSAPLIPLVILGIGAYLTWFGVHYWGSDTRWPTEPVKAVLQGKPLPGATGRQTAASVAASVEQGQAFNSAVTGSGNTIQPGVSSTGAMIAAAAQKYTGTGYVWGGPADVPGDWDCSSFASYVLGHDLGMKLPGGGRYGDPGYPPHSHGPTTLNYLLYGSPVNLGSERPGDLLVTSEHMGIVIGGGLMVSAQDPQSGTGTGSYSSGFPGGTPFVRRPGG